MGKRGKDRSRKGEREERRREERRGKEKRWWEGGRKGRKEGNEI